MFAWSKVKGPRTRLHVPATLKAAAGHESGLWIEILSPEHRTIRINQKAREVPEFAVPYIRVIDPETLESELHTQSGSRSLLSGVLRLEGTPIEVPLRLIEQD